MTMIVTTPDLHPAACCVCGKRLPKCTDGLGKVSLMLDQTGQPKGWGCAVHAIDLPRVIRQASAAALCRTCGLPLTGEHTVTQGAAWCRDGRDFVLA